MKQKRLPPKPEPLPEGFMYYAGHIEQIEDVAYYSSIKIRMMGNYSWKKDPTYNMKIAKKGTSLNKP